MKKRLTDIIEKLQKSIKDITKTQDKTEVYRKIEILLKDLTDSEYASLLLFDKEKQCLHRYGKSKGISMLSIEGCLGKVFLTKRAKIYNHLISDKEYIEAYDNPNARKLKSQMLMPVLDDDALIGVVRVSRKIQPNSKKYTKNDLEMLHSIHSYLIKIIHTLIKKSALTIDKTSLKKTEEKITKIQKESQVSDPNEILLFLSSTVHDIRTPANSLYGFLELMEEQIKDKRLKQFVENAKESADLINTLTNSILEKTKNKYEENLSKTVTLNCADFLEKTANIFSAKMTEKKIDYFIFIDPKLPSEIEIDPLKLKRVLINLLGNAYKFTPKYHQIECLATYDEEHATVKIQVKDTGIGIEKETQKKLFEVFTQASDTTHMEYGGSGLGLSISSKYVSELGGELKVKSRLGEGSEFYFSIPLNVTNCTMKCSALHDLDKYILILTEDTACKHARYIASYLSKFGIAEENIKISSKIEKETIHMICFEHKLSDDVYDFIEKNDVKLLQIEEKMFSLMYHDMANGYDIVSKNTHYGSAIYQLIRDSSRVKVLIVDDNKINVELLTLMLTTECTSISSSTDSQKALQMLEDAARKDEPFDIVYLDKHMPELSGLELLKQFRDYEQKKRLKPIYAVSISGDPDVFEEEKALYNAFVTKPFSSKGVREVISQYKSNA